MLNWSCMGFEALTPSTLYALLRLRSEVFVLEQRCLYLDADGLDLTALHVIGTDAQGRVSASARLLPPFTKGPSQHRPVIGRVVTAPHARGLGQGRALMQEALRVCERQWRGLGQALSAQAHLQPFYASLGFQPVSEVYEEDGIPHIDMQRG